jgi:hypothetical protein
MPTLPLTAGDRRPTTATTTVGDDDDRGRVSGDGLDGVGVSKTSLR